MIPSAPEVPKQFQGELSPASRSWWEAKPTLTQADRQLLKWLDSLGLPPAPKKGVYMLVQVQQVTNGNDIFSGWDTGNYQPSAGVVVSHTREKIVLNHALWPTTYSASIPKRAAKAPAVARWRAFACQNAKCAQPPRPPWSPLTLKNAKPHVSLELVLQARLMAAQGLEPEAALLLASARRLRPKLSVDTLRTELGKVMLWETIHSCSRLGVSPKELQHRFELVSRHMGGSSAHEASRYQRVLKRMAVETPQSCAPTPISTDLGRELITLPGRNVADLVFRLRDITNIDLAYLRMAIAALPQVRRATLEGMPNSAITGLAIQDLAVVPSMLTLLEDDRLTRAAGAVGPDATKAVIRYRDAALMVLSCVARRTFQQPKQARAWWARVQAHGELPVVTAMAREGKPDAPGLLGRLFELDPELALRVTREVLPKLKGQPRVTTVQLLASRPGDEVTDLLAGILKREKNPGVWSVTAQTLAARPNGERPVLEALKGKRRADVTNIITILVDVGDPHILRRELPVLLPRLSLNERIALLCSVGTLKPDQSSRDAMVEVVLARALADETKVPSYGSPRGNGYANVVMGDVAADLLAHRWELPFNPGATATQRARARRALLNRWRSLQGLPIVP